jgi:SAM-dependent methyltransferase
VNSHHGVKQESEIDAFRLGQLLSVMRSGSGLSLRPPYASVRGGPDRPWRDSAPSGWLTDARLRPANSRDKLLDLNRRVCEAWDREWPTRRPKLRKRAAEITFLDPACGSGHFLLEAFDLLYDMYLEESPSRAPEDICASILNHNLFGVDIDERAIQIAHAALWMHARERAELLSPRPRIGS